MPSPAIAGIEPIRREAWPPRSAIYAHGNHECLVCDLADDGTLFLECDCGLTSVELADAIGIDRARLNQIEIAASARSVAERFLALDPEHRVAIATIALLGT